MEIYEIIMMDNIPYESSFSQGLYSTIELANKKIREYYEEELQEYMSIKNTEEKENTLEPKLEKDEDLLQLRGKYNIYYIQKRKVDE